MRKLVPSKQNILVAVKLPIRKNSCKKLGFLLLKKNKRIVKERRSIVHADDVANGMVFSLNREGSSIDDLRVPLIRNPSKIESTGF